MISTNITGTSAYSAIQNGMSSFIATDLETATPAPGTSSFGAMVQNAVSGLVESGKAADAKSADALTGKGNLTDVVMAVSKAEMALQATVAVRDKVISAYQDIMKMAV
jgi:flagellar hook-basal body complex protein FliE